MLDDKSSEGQGVRIVCIGWGSLIALISRLAYADLSKEAGKPTLILLDDALVNTDGQRLDLMQRVLYETFGRSMEEPNVAPVRGLDVRTVPARSGS